MKKYEIEVDYGADLMEIYEYEALENEDNLLERIEEGEFDVVEACCYGGIINEVRIDGQNVKGWHDECQKDLLEMPKKGLCAIGGVCRGTTYFTLELPDDEKLDPTKLFIDTWCSVYYQLDKNHTIEAEMDEDGDAEDDLFHADEYYYNGKLISEE